MYKLDLTEDIYQHMRKHDIWVFCYESTDMKKPWTQSAVKKRIYKENNMLVVRKFKGDKDVFNLHLNPRTEIRLDTKHLNWNQEYTLLYQCQFDRDIDATIMQIMGRPNVNNKNASPIWQVENRHNKFDFRGWGIGTKVNGKLSPGVKRYFGDKVTYNKPYTFIIHYKPHNKNGIMKVWCNDELVLDHKGYVYDNSGAPNWVQFGVYGGGVPTPTPTVPTPTPTVPTPTTITMRVEDIKYIHLEDNSITFKYK
jgi:hypothetical protein